MLGKVSLKRTTRQKHHLLRHFVVYVWTTLYKIWWHRFVLSVLSEILRFPALQICLYFETHTWASSPPVELLQEICQSKHSCKCYGNMLCVALSLKENMTILCVVPLWAVDTYFTNVISARAVVFAASYGPSGFIHCSFVATVWMEKEIGCGCCFMSTTVCRGLCRWCSCNSTNTVINAHAPGLR